MIMFYKKYKDFEINMCCLQIYIPMNFNVNCIFWASE